jgi:hypothetical protein
LSCRFEHGFALQVVLDFGLFALLGFLRAQGVVFGFFGCKVSGFRFQVWGFFLLRA